MVLSLVCGLALFGFALGDGVWSTRKDMLYKRSDFTASVLSGFAGSRTFIVLTGGCVSVGGCVADGSCPCVGITNATTAYNPDTDSWTELAEAPVARFRHSAAVVNSKLYVFGGRTVDDQLITQVDVYDPVTGSWNTTTAWPAATSDLASFVHNGVIYAIGGYNAGFVSQTSTWQFVPANSTWIGGVVAPLIVGRGDSCAAIVNGKGFLLGGWNEADGFCTPLDDVDVYDFAANNWTKAGDMHHPAGDKSCGTLHGELHVFGGERKDNGCANVSTPIDESEVFNVTSNTWQEETPMPISRFRFTAVTWRPANSTNDQLFVFGGQAPYNATTLTLELLNIVSVFTDDIPNVPVTTATSTSSSTTGVSSATTERCALALTALAMAALFVL